MRINNIYLKNFRTHKELKCEFSTGMNLLLGQNGSGKSSILEAIGITLFDSKYRDGNSKGQEQVIKFGEKEALVTIEFTGNDGLIYVVENQLKKGTGYKRLYKKDDRENMLESKDEISRELKFLVGIEGDLGGTYENIIVSKQNEFINIYKLKATDRKKVFDEIFETDIYEKIYRGFSKDVGDRYKSELEGTKAVLGTLRGKVENPEAILTELRDVEKSKISVDESLKTEGEIKKSLERQIDENSYLVKKIESGERDILGDKKILENSLEAMTQNQRDIEDGDRSLKIVNENRESYDNYITLQEEGIEQREKIITLEDEIGALREKELEIKDLEKKSLEISGEIDRNRIYQVSNRENYEKNLEIRTQEERAYNLAKKREEELNLEEIEIVPLIAQCESFERELKLVTSSLEMEEGKLSEEREELIKIREKFKLYEKDGLEEKIEKLVSKVEIEKSLQGEINKILALLENSREAEKKLSTNICPFLSERCKNLESSSGAEEFFREREEKFLNSLKNSENSLIEIREELKSLDSLKREKIERELLKEALVKLEKAVEGREREITISLLKKENLNLKLGNFKKESGTLEKLIERKITLTEEKKYLNIENIEKNISKINNEISDLERDFNIFTEKSNKLEKSYNYLIIQIDFLKSKTIKLPLLDVFLIKEKKIFKDLEGKLAELKIPYDLYNRNLDRALKLESYMKKNEVLKDRIEKIKLEITKLEENIAHFKKELENKIPIISLEEERRTIEEKILYLHRESGSLLSKIEELKERAKKSQNDYIEIENLEKKEKILQKKQELTAKFRDNVKGMGEKVAESIIKRIAFFATENFRKITGRGESIVWSGKDSSGKDSAYSVVLEGIDREGNIRKVNFDQLSGGEQVAVAISIRGAMNSIFTKTGFSIFDEPTNNLDQERRKILADNIGEILKDMEQSIIVTHDDTFKEMAQQVIEL